MAMEIIKMKKEHLDEVSEIAYGMYLEEQKYEKELRLSSKEKFCNKVKKSVFHERGYVCVKQGKVFGYLSAKEFLQEDGTTWCMVPIWGYGAIGSNREKILSMLFQKMAEELCENKTVHFEIKLYAHDEGSVRLFSYLQFGIQCEEGISSTKGDIHASGERVSEEEMCRTRLDLDTDVEIPHETEITVEELSKQEIKERWGEIWSLLSRLIGHLQKSPVFYPGEEFTEEVYKRFFLDEDTYVYAAKKAGSMIGLIEANADGNEFLSDNEGCYNVGDIFVADEFRGKGVAQKLLAYVKDALQAKKIDSMWVEHGTANPNARGFWNKYFDSYCYTMIRDIKGC
ncbi:MAG: GNAT family N-acetyltransferase [Lachnospiraceae bacterium]|nr:GNAT family N-acetyltransferase [Lachnospiraceae bacterium]